MEKQEVYFKVYLTTKERYALNLIARKRKLKQTQTIRALIMQEYNKLSQPALNLSEEELLLAYIKKHCLVTSKQITENFGWNSRELKRLILKLKKAGEIESRIAKRQQFYCLKLKKEVKVN